MKEESGVIRVSATVEDFENLLRNKIYEKLGDDKDALKLFEVTRYKPADRETKKMMLKHGIKLFNISGALGLDDGENGGWKAFHFQMEEGLSEKADNLVAEQLAHQCLKCIATMKRERTEAMELKSDG